MKISARNRAASASADLEKESLADAAGMSVVPPASQRREPVSPGAPAPGHRSGSRIDMWELATAAFVLLAAAVPGSPWFAHAVGIVTTTVIFEFGMAWLAVCASWAESMAKRGPRAGAVLLGVAMVTVGGIGEAIQLDRPATILPGLWIIATRVRKPPGTAAFDARHCRAIALEATVSWCSLLGIFVLLILYDALFARAGLFDLTQGGLFAVAWGMFYGALSILKPIVRRRALKGGPRKDRGLLRIRPAWRRSRQ